MFLSRIRIKPGRLARVTVRNAFGNPYATHRLLWSFFPSDADAARDFLYREDRSRGAPQLFVVSGRRPEPPSNDYQVATKDFAPRLRTGDRLAFVLRANPVIRRATGSGAGKRHDVVMDAKARAAGDDDVSAHERVSAAVGSWLERRAERAGFTVGDAPIIHSYRQHRLFPGNGRSPIAFSAVDVDGRLTVTDPDAFTQMLGRGLGASRGFGCGLMLVRRA